MYEKMCIQFNDILENPNVKDRLWLYKNMLDKLNALDEPIFSAKEIANIHYNKALDHFELSQSPEIVAFRKSNLLVKALDEMRQAQEGYTHPKDIRSCQKYLDAFNEQMCNVQRELSDAHLQSADEPIFYPDRPRSPKKRWLETALVFFPHVSDVSDLNVDEQNVKARKLDEGSASASIGSTGV